MSKNSEYPLALPVGTELVGDYVITKILGAGGFGITYEAKERSLDRLVAIKEFFPIDIVERDGWALVKARSKDLDVKYARGLRRFIEEAKAVTQFNHPNIVRVLRYFKTNNTAFMVLHYEEGADFDQWQRNLKRRPTEDELRSIMLPLLDALELIHKSDFLHRDVAPDNIIIRKDGSPVLIDFGSARSELTFTEKTVSALVKTGYSPFEQYARTSKEQGPWTDIYSFGATLYQAVTLVAPADSLSRLATDELVPAAKLAKKYYSRPFLEAIDKALRVKIQERPQTVREWRDMLFPPAPGEVAAAEPKKVKTGERKLDIVSNQLSQQLKAVAHKAAALKPADLSGSMAKAAHRAKENLRDLLPAERSPRKPPVAAIAVAQEKTPAPASPEMAVFAEAAEPVDGRGARRHRSLMSLLSELDHRRSAKQQSKADAAKAATELATGGQPKRSLFFWRKRNKPKPTLLARFFGLPLLSALVSLAFLAALVAGVIYFREPLSELELGDITELAEDIQLPDFKGQTPLMKPGHSKLARTIAAHGDGVRFLGLSKDGKELVSASKSGVRLWSLETGDEMRTLAIDSGTYNAVDVFDDLLLLGQSDGTVNLYDLRNGKRIVSFEGLPGGLTTLAFAGNGYDFIVGGADGELLYWAYENNAYTQQKFRRKLHTGDLSAIASDDRFIVTGATDTTAKFWSRPRRNLLRTYRGHTDTLTAIALSPNGRRVATANLDGTARIWSTRSRRVRRILDGHEGGVLSVAFSPDSEWLATGGADRTVKLWNVRSGKLAETFQGHNGPVRTLAFGKQGKRLISGSDDGNLRIWDLDDQDNNS